MDRLNYSSLNLLILFIGAVMICSFGLNTVSAANASTIYVSTNGNDNYDGLSDIYNITSGSGPKATIKNATKTVLTNGTIYISNGIYYENGIIINNNMKIIGENQNNTIIKGVTYGSIFTINSNVSLFNLTLTNLNGLYGALSNTGNVTVDKCTFTGNKGTEGAAIYNIQGTTTITNSIFTNNTGTLGGAIYNSQGTTTITNSILTSNTGNQGGVIYNSQGTTTITNNILTSNIGTSGGIIYNNLGTTTVTNNILTNNRGNSGGVIYSINGTITVIKNTIENNTGTKGGVIFNDQNGTFFISFNRIVGNKGTQGNVIYNLGGTVDANKNWWGSNKDPSTNLIGTTLTSWLVLTINANPDTISKNNSTVTVDILHDQNGNYLDPNLNCIPDGIPITLTATNGYLNNSSVSLMNGQAMVIFTATTEGTGNITATADNQNVSTQLTIYPHPVVNSTDPQNSTITNNSMKEVKINFNIPIFAGTAYNDIKIIGSSGYIPITVTIQGNSLILTPITNYADGTYTVNIPVNAVMDMLGKGLETSFSSSFTVDATKPTANATPKGGLYNSTQTVTLTTNKPGTIYYTTDGQDPTTDSAKYTAPITVNTKTTLKYFAIDLNGNISQIYTEIYVIDTTTPRANATQRGGIYNSTQTVKLSMDTAGTIYYTTDGTIPTTSSNRYSSPIVVSKSETLKFIAVNTAGNVSNVYTENYVIDKTLPTATALPKEGIYNTSKTITLYMSKSGTIYYTLNGTTPTNKSNVYTKPLTISKTTVLKFFMIDLAGNKSPVYTKTYTIDKTAPKPVQTTPAQNSNNVSLKAPITIKFSENIFKGDNFSKIYIKNLSTGKIAKSTVLSISGNTITIKMTMSRLSFNTYQIFIPTDAVKDQAGNNNTKYTLNFKSGKY